MKSLYTPTTKQIYFWNLAGSILNAMLSVVLLLFVSILLNDREADIFSLAWSFGMQAMTVGTFQARLYQATDIEEKYSFNQYLFFRAASVLAMFVYSAIYVWLSGFSFYKALIILLVCIAKSADAFSDLFQGWFQQKERLDLAGKAFSAHSLALLIVFAITVLFSKNLLIACIFMIIGNYITFFLFDYRYYLLAKQKFNTHTNNPSKAFLIKLAGACFPLFINAYFIMDIFNQPRFSIDSAIGTGFLADGSQKIYNILFLPASVLNLIFFIFRPLITKLALCWTDNNKKDFLKIIRTISLGLLIMSIVVFLGGWFLGCPILSFVYDVPLGEYKSVLMLLILGGVFNAFMYLFDNAITVMRKHRYLIIAYAITWLYTVLTVDSFVNKFGLLGASLCFATSMLLILLCTVILFLMFIKAKKEKTIR